MSEKIRDYGKLANDIIREVGGDKNIVNATRCATRLRLVLAETPPDARETISGMPGVITVVENGGQFQVVIGNHVGEVFEEVSNILGLEKGEGEESAENKQSVFNRVIATMSGVFAPIVYLLAGSGILQGVLIVITIFAPEVVESGTYQIFNLMSWAPFTFLPLLIAITASKHFRCNEFTAIACCCALVSPAFTSLLQLVSEGETIRLFGVKLAETAYTSTVLPPLILVWVLSYLERFVKKHLPEVVKQLLTPLICFAVMVPLTLIVIGPVSQMAANGIANGYNHLEKTVPILTAAIGGGLWEVLVIFGVHWALNPMILADFALNGTNSLDMYIAFAVAGQMAAALAVALKSRNREMKNMSLSAGITAVFGITEPAIYGVTLRLKKPFIAACIGGAAGSAAACLMGSTYYVYTGLPGPITFVNAMNGETGSMLGAVAGTVVSIAAAFVLTMVMGFEDPKEKKIEADAIIDEKAAPKSEVTAESSDGREIIGSPLTGEIIPMEEVHDQVFASGAIGKGIALIPLEGKVYAPADGTVAMLYDTLHAIGFQTVHGTELLIHVGLDTVKLEGKYFNAHVKQGDAVKKGDLLLEFSMDKIRESGYELETPVIVTNKEFKIMVPENSKTVEAGQQVMVIQ